ncbi:hypothetical protein [Plantactinospora endophytica]|uniref:hypothetical protein n=1 Tax=Plantactinospora endophytica TaxID=673535 RepID=UPI0019424EF5|nr:hypothetical protein [Plantactinospora endophytica]
MSAVLVAVALLFATALLFAVALSFAAVLLVADLLVADLLGVDLLAVLLFRALGVAVPPRPAATDVADFLAALLDGVAFAVPLPAGGSTTISGEDSTADSAAPTGSDEAAEADAPDESDEVADNSEEGAGDSGAVAGGAVPVDGADSAGSSAGASTGTSGVVPAAAVGAVRVGITARSSWLTSTVGSSPGVSPPPAPARTTSSVILVAFSVTSMRNVVVARVWSSGEIVIV